jgi:hypothetical protein
VRIGIARRDKIYDMSETPQSQTKTPAVPAGSASSATGVAGQSAGQSAGHHAATGTGPKIHRVCIGCNNMFEVTMDNYEAKHCSTCHKG